MLVTRVQAPLGAFLGVELMMRVFMMLSTSVASPSIISSWRDRISSVIPGWERSSAVSFDGVRARALAL